jgi:outer membrane protein OmpA-like peptidoglycan-associated protein
MSTSPSFVTLVTAAVLGIAAGTAWSTETAPKAGATQGWYPPPPPGGYAQQWQPQGQQAAQPLPYAGSPYYYPPRQPQQAAAKPTPAEATTEADDPLAAELARVKKQLAATEAKLEQSESTHKETRTAAAALEKKLAGLGREHKALQARATELAGELKASKATLKQHRQQLTSDQQLIRTLIADRARLRNQVANLDYRLAGLLDNLQNSAQALQQAQADPAECTQQLGEATAQSVALQNELAELESRLQNGTTMLEQTEQQLDAVTAERDGLNSDLAGCREELTRAEAALKTARAEAQAARSKGQAEPAAAAAGSAAAGLASQDPAADTDQDGVPDIIDLCPGTGAGIAVEATGCVAGATILLAGVDFHSDSQELTGAAQRSLDHIAGILNQLPELRMEVAGHTGTSGDPSFNQWLSLQRAEAVVDYLVAKGVSEERLSAAGYGGQQPVSSETTPEAMRMNRRIELRPRQ